MGRRESQDELGLSAPDAQSPHLDEERGRIWLRMELRALAEALRREGELDGPVLLLRQNDLRASFNPNELVPMDDEGTYYPPGPFRPPGAA